MPTALITGGTTGIGSATADLLHSRGYQVAVTGQNADSLARARSELPDHVLVVRSDARVLGSRRGGPGATVGAATRGALPAMVPSLALELAPRRIRVNAVSPGITDTPLIDKLGSPQSGRDAMRSKIPFKRFGSSQEVAEVVAFLASDAAGYITGQDVTVAGGYGLGA
ncbi:SDR family oxidoreductase [Streptomyces sp. NPDC058291]|uniref:SDR family oxidoreductase n=1 Tax=Streptomyces sp. NPDC058291 TaxID=3346427 RepID=UPI0036E595D4